MDAGAIIAALTELTKKDFPVEHGIKGYYEYRGYPGTEAWQPLHGLKAALLYDRFRPDDVVIHTYQKSGTHFIGDVVKSILLEAGGFQCSQHLDGVMFPMAFLETHPLESPENPMENVDMTPSPRIIATHLPWNLLPEGAYNNSIKHIQLIRNPKDVLCSVFPFIKSRFLIESYSWEQFVETTVTNGKGFLMDYFDYLRTWYTQRQNKSLLTLCYEDMKQDLRSAVESISDFLGVSLNCEQISRIVDANTFENRIKTSNAIAAMFLNKGKTGEWKYQLTVAQNEAVDKWISEGVIGLDELKIKFQ